MAMYTIEGQLLPVVLSSGIVVCVLLGSHCYHRGSKCYGTCRFHDIDKVVPGPLVSEKNRGEPLAGLVLTSTTGY
jgi:hypothetical protein